MRLSVLARLRDCVRIALNLAQSGQVFYKQAFYVHVFLRAAELGLALGMEGFDAFTEIIGLP